MWDGYKTPRWRRLREKILRRDGYMSVESKRYGRFVQANTVHHVWRAEDFPEYAWQPWNLISVTEEEHGTFHGPNGELTELGESWRRRIRPPAPLDSATTSDL